jgi:hypothetical protein
VSERFDIMTLCLLGQALPPLPELPGRVHRAVADEPEDEAPTTVAELVERTGLSRMGAHLRLVRYRRYGDLVALLQPRPGHEAAVRAARIQTAQSAGVHRAARLLDAEDDES